MNIVDRIAQDLNDPKHIAWSREDITDWVSEAVGIAVSLQPELFKTRKVIKLDACTEYQEVTCCDFIFSVIGESTKDGRLIRRLRRASQWFDDWSITLCPSKRWNGLKRYAILSDKDLYVAPQLPPNEEAYLLIECTSKDDVDANNLPTGVDVAIIMWVLYRARSMDAESSVVADMGESNYLKMKELLSKFTQSTRSKK